jgi:acyl dehydratase
LRYYEDYEIGERRQVGSYRVSRDELLEFARRFDPQPFHIDEVAAKESIFGGLTGSSCHTFALMSLIYAQSGEETAHVANLGAENLRFPSPLRPEDELTMWSECKALRTSKSRPGIGIVTTRTVLTNQRDEIVMEMTGSTMVKRRPGD